MPIKTDAQVRAARVPAGKREARIPVPGHIGLFLLVRPTGKSWLFRWKYNGKSEVISLGPYPQITLAKARENAANCRTRRAEGLHPKPPEKVEPQAAMDVRGLFSTWRETDLSSRKDSGASVQKLFERYVLGQIGDRPAGEVRRGDVAALLDEARKKKVSRTVGLILSSLRQMYRFGIDREFVEVDPTAMLKPSKFGVTNVERDRILTSDELVTLASQLRLSTPDQLLPGQARMKDETKLALWLLLATGLRIGELLTLHWRDVDLKTGMAMVRLEDTKTKQHQQTVYLSAFALARFNELAETTKRSGNDPGWCWPALRKPGSPVCTKTINKQINDRQRTQKMNGRSKAGDSLSLPGGKWTPHDLRRTAASTLRRLKVARDVIERMLNHADENKVARIYQRDDLNDERRAAWQVLGKYLQGIMDEADRVTDIT
jgi:integrase